MPVSTVKKNWEFKSFRASVSERTQNTALNKYLRFVAGYTIGS